MTDQERKAMQMALEALENADFIVDMADSHYGIEPEDRLQLIEALRQALAQPEQEPVAYLDAVDRKTVYVAPNRKRWLDQHKDKEWNQFHYDHQYDIPLYTQQEHKEQK